MSSVVFVAGARPNFMKTAPIMKALAARAGAIAELVHTGQHYDFEMSGVFLKDLMLPAPVAHFELGSGGHGAQTGAIMSAFERYLLSRSAPPRGVVVVGDVNSTMACALVAVKLGIPLAHVEAGLRSFDRAMPEEINRVVTDAVADLLFVSEPAGLENLAREAIPASRTHYVGNVMIDTLVAQLPAARALAMPEQLGVPRGQYALVTMHRPSNVDNPERLHAVVALLRRIAGELPVIFPVHPRTRKRLDALGATGALAADPRIHLCAPLGYREFLGTMEGARVVITDSGGVQEETTYLGVPCITLRTTTERPITTSRGTNVLVGESLDAAWSAVTKVLLESKTPPVAIDGWDGRAATRIVDIIGAEWR